MRIVQISDTHLFEGGGVTARNTERVVTFVNETLRPDLIIHSGDIVGLTPDHGGDRRAAVDAHSELRAPLLAVPGNHDVGEPGERAWMGLAVTAARVSEHRRAFGDDHFLETFDGWGVLGLNSQLLGSGLREEDEQWDWLAATLAAAGGRSLILFLHRPLWNPTPGDTSDDNNVPDRARERLLALPGAERLTAVGSGHLHRYRRHERRGLLEVWAPGVACPGSRTQEPAHFRQCGIVEWRLEGNTVNAWFRAPASLEEPEFMDIPEAAARFDELHDDRDGKRCESQSVTRSNLS
jgi:3',5'-cyclic AMP phosphodiesterase CpdA